MKFAKITILLLVALLFLVNPQIKVFAEGEAVVTDADSVWNSSLTSASSDVIDSTDAPTQNLIKYAFVSHADSVWNTGLTSASSDVLDSTDAPEENLIKWAFVSHADSVWNAELEKNGWETPENQPLTCSIELQKDGKEIDEIDVGESFDIVFTNYSGDIKEVRFLSDESQNKKIDEGFTWTDPPYNWNASSTDWTGHWDASNKIKTWAFATPGKKEVWAEIKDSNDAVSFCSSSIFADLPNIIVLNPLQKSLFLKISLEIEKYIEAVIHELSNTITPSPIELARIPIFTTYKINPSQKINTVLMLSSDPEKIIQKYKKVTIHLTESNSLKEFLNKPNTPIVLPGYLNMSFNFPSERWGCLQTIVARKLISLYENPIKELAKEVGSKILGIPKIVTTGVDVTSCSIFSGPSVNKEQEIIWNGGSGEDFGVKDIIVYLPILEPPLPLKINVQALFSQPPQPLIPYLPVVGKGEIVTGMKAKWSGNISEELSEISLSLYETSDPRIILTLFSPGELRVYDSQGRITGLVNGKVREGIPNSMYDAENKTVVIFDPFDTYRYEVVGTDTGTYGLDITSIKNGESTTFHATGIPTKLKEVHQYTIDWDKLSKGEKGATLKIDLEGDGTFDKTIHSGKNLESLNNNGESNSSLLDSYGNITGIAHVVGPSFYICSHVDDEKLLINEKPSNCGYFGISKTYRTFRTKELGGINFNYSPEVQFSVRAKVATTTPQELGLRFGYYDSSDNVHYLCSATTTLSNNLEDYTISGNCNGSNPTNVKRFFYEFKKGCPNCSYEISKCHTKSDDEKFYTGVKITN